MSIETWKAEFYPEEAGVEMTELEAVQHSIKKWEGLQPDALRDYEVHWCSLNTITDGDEMFYIDGSTCALCQLYGESCKPCPLSKVRGGTSCCNLRPDETYSPWTLRDTQPQVMLMWLERAEEYLVNQPEVEWKGGDL